MKPVVDGLEKELGEQLVILRVDIHTTAGRTLSKEYNFEYTPTFILFDSSGTELWREVGSLNTERIRQSVAND